MTQNLYRLSKDLKKPPVKHFNLHTNVPIFVRMPFYENVYPFFRLHRKYLLFQLRLDGNGRLNLFLRRIVV